MTSTYIPLLTDLQTDVLREMRDYSNPEWMCPAAIAALLEVPSYHVRDAVNKLRRERLVERSQTIDHVGDYRITDKGVRALHRNSQLRLA
jgi:Mn-dependent DtxR family transcriptional regulator